jgi:FkbM family methyltransferase
MQRLARLIGDRVSQRDPVTTAPMKLGYRMRVDLRSRTEVFSYYSGHYDTGWIRAAVELLQSGGVALDIGGNVGFWSVPLAQRGRVHAFEPVPNNADRIDENARLNHVDVAVHRMALSDIPGSLRLSLREDFERGACTGNAAVVIDQADERFSVIDVPTETLDAWATNASLDRLDVVKLDVEGHEDRVLTGGRQTLARFRPVIFMEWNSDYYARRGVNPTSVLSRALDGLDYTCLRREAAGWAHGPISSPFIIDDLVLTPIERAGEVESVLAASF